MQILQGRSESVDVEQPTRSRARLTVVRPEPERCPSSRERLPPELCLTLVLGAGALVAFAVAISG